MQKNRHHEFFSTPTWQPDSFTNMGIKQNSQSAPDKGCIFVNMNFSEVGYELFSKFDRIITTNKTWLNNLLTNRAVSAISCQIMKLIQSTNSFVITEKKYQEQIIGFTYFLFLLLRPCIDSIAKKPVQQKLAASRGRTRKKKQSAKNALRLFQSPNLLS